MTPRRRWIARIIEDSATLDLVLPWERQVRHRRGRGAPQALRA